MKNKYKEYDFIINRKSTFADYDKLLTRYKIETYNDPREPKEPVFLIIDKQKGKKYVLTINALLAVAQALRMIENDWYND